MAYIMFVLSVGLSLGAQMIFFALATTLLVCVVILALTKINFGRTNRHESLIRLMCKAPKGATVDTVTYEVLLSKLTDAFQLLNAQTRGDRMELTCGVRPRKASTTLSSLDALSKEKGIEDEELFDAKHQVEI